MKAVIFDMDGVLVHNTPYHVKAWKMYLKKLGFNFSAQEIRRRFHGRTNAAIFRDLFGRKFPGRLIKKYSREKEILYRKLYKGRVEALRGLLDFLKILSRRRIRIALATSTPAENVDFLMRSLKIRKYFRKISDASHVKHGKPHPEIYLLSAKLLRVEPKDCLVFEDSLFGIESAKRAKMKVVGVTTTHTRSELAKADLFIKDFSQSNQRKIFKLIDRL